MDDKEKLERFLWRADKLRSLTMVKEGMGYKVSLSLFASSFEDGSIKTSFPDEETFESFLVRFRHFIAKQRPVVNVEHILNICHKRLKPNSELEDYFKEARIAWRKAVNKSGLRLVFNERELSTQDIADLWIKGHYFHDDKFLELENMPAFQKTLVEANFVEFLIQGTHVIIGLRNLIEDALKNDHFRF